MLHFLFESVLWIGIAFVVVVLVTYAIRKRK